MKNKKLLLAVTVLMMSFMLCACGHEHEWKEATCTDAKICNTCGETEGSALGHEWKEATCTEAKVCNTCGETEGNALGHELNDTGKCRVCGEQIGYALNSSNYKQYLNITFSEEEIDSPYDLIKGEKLTVNVEPLKNVKFENVRINYEYTQYLSSYYRIDGKAVQDKQCSGSVKLNSEGYGSGSSSSSFWIKNGKFVGISGYVIE